MLRAQSIVHSLLESEDESPQEAYDRIKKQIIDSALKKLKVEWAGHYSYAWVYVEGYSSPVALITCRRPGVLLGRMTLTTAGEKLAGMKLKMDGMTYMEVLERLMQIFNADEWSESDPYADEND